MVGPLPWCGGDSVIGVDFQIGDGSEPDVGLVVGEVLELSGVDEGVPGLDGALLAPSDRLLLPSDGCRCLSLAFFYLDETETGIGGELLGGGDVVAAQGDDGGGVPQDRGLDALGPGR